MQGDQHASYFNVPPPKYVTAALFFIQMQYTDESAAVHVLTVKDGLYGKH
jgi:hypothetical protein